MKNLPLLLLLFVLAGCDRKAYRDEAKFDALLATGRIDRVELIDDDRERTNVFAGDRAAVALQAFAPTNRVARKSPVWTKIYFSGLVRFCTGSNYVVGVHYTPDVKAFAYGKYYFAPKATNEAWSFFE